MFNSGLNVPGFDSDADIRKMAAMLDRGNILGAVMHVDKAIRRRPDAPLLYTNKASLFADIGRLAEAEVCCRKAISLDPKCTHAYEVMGIVLRRSKKPAEAMSYYNEAVRLYDPEKETKLTLARMYSNMGTAMSDLDRLEDSVRCYDESIKVDPSYATAYRNKGASLKRMGRTDEAEQCILIAMVLDPDFAELILNSDHMDNAPL